MACNTVSLLLIHCAVADGEASERCIGLRLNGFGHLKQKHYQIRSINTKTHFSDKMVTERNMQLSNCQIRAVSTIVCFLALIALKNKKAPKGHEY